MTTVTPGAPLRLQRLGRAFALTRAIDVHGEREAFVSMSYWP
jgi:hypothetical protein